MVLEKISGAPHTVRFMSSGALPLMRYKQTPHQNRSMTIFVVHQLVCFFFPKKLYMYIPKYMSDLIKKNYLICQ